MITFGQTVGVCLLVLVVPVLVDPVIGSKPTISMDNILVHGISITVAYVIAALISGLFAGKDA